MLRSGVWVIGLKKEFHFIFLNHMWFNKDKQESVEAKFAKELREAVPSWQSGKVHKNPGSLFKKYITGPGAIDGTTTLFQTKSARNVRIPATVVQKSRPQVLIPDANVTHPWKVSVNAGVAVVDIDSFIYDKDDYQTTVTVNNLTTGGDPTEFTVASGDTLYLVGTYSSGSLDSVDLVVSSGEDEIETALNGDDPPVAEQTYWRYPIATFTSEDSHVVVDVQVARCQLRLVDRYYQGKVVEYPIAL